MLSEHDLIHLVVEFYSRICRGLILIDLRNLAMLLMPVFPSLRILCSHTDLPRPAKAIPKLPRERGMTGGLQRKVKSQIKLEVTQ